MVFEGPPSLVTLRPSRSRLRLAKGNLLKKPVILALLLSIPAFCGTDPEILRKAESAGTLLDVGNVVCMLSGRGILPGFYDAGILTMMTGKKKLIRGYDQKFHEAPPQFGESGESAYTWGWIYKGAAVGSLFVGSEMDNVGVALIGFTIFYLTGVAKHWEASRLLYDEGSNTKSLILDESQPLSRIPADRMKLAYSFAF
jgi:hypothetical protein